MYDEAFYDYLTALKLIPKWFVTSKMIKKIYTALQKDDGLLFFDEDSGNVTFCCNKMSILGVLILIIILMKMILILLFLSDFWLGIVNLENAKHLKKR